MSWEGFGGGGQKARWFQQLNMLSFKTFSNQQVEIRILTKDPFHYTTHWFFRNVEDAWLFYNDREAFKAKYPDARKVQQFSFECPDTDHMTGMSAMKDCPDCVTYQDYQPWPNRYALVQAFYRIPKSRDKSLQNWSKDPIVLQMGKGIIKKLGRVINTQGDNIHEPKTGYSIFITYTPNAGADTWAVDYGRPTPLTREQWNAYKESKIDFNEIYEAGDIDAHIRDLNRMGYPKLLDGTLDATGGKMGGAGGRAAPAGSRSAASAGNRQAAPARGRQAPPPVEDDFVESGDDFDLNGDTTEGYEDDVPLEDDDLAPEDGVDDMSYEEDVPPQRRSAPPQRRSAPPQRPANTSRQAAPGRPAGRPSAPPRRP